MSAWQRADAAQPSINHTVIELPCALISEGNLATHAASARIQDDRSASELHRVPRGHALGENMIDERSALRFLARVDD
jgi:hypothetical protein